MAIDAALKNSDTDIKIDGTKRAVDSFKNDPMQTDYAKVYMDTIWEVVESIIADYERDVSFLEGQLKSKGWPEEV